MNETKEVDSEQQQISKTSESESMLVKVLDDNNNHNKFNIDITNIEPLDIQKQANKMIELIKKFDLKEIKYIQYFHNIIHESWNVENINITPTWSSFNLQH